MKYEVNGYFLRKITLVLIMLLVIGNLKAAVDPSSFTLLGVQGATWPAGSSFSSCGGDAVVTSFSVGSNQDGIFAVRYGTTCINIDAWSDKTNIVYIGAWGTCSVGMKPTPMPTVNTTYYLYIDITNEVVKLQTTPFTCSSSSLTCSSLSPGATNYFVEFKGEPAVETRTPLTIGASGYASGTNFSVTAAGFSFTPAAGCGTATSITHSCVNGTGVTTNLSVSMNTGAAAQSYTSPVSFAYGATTLSPTGGGCSLTGKLLEVNLSGNCGVPLEALSGSDGTPVEFSLAAGAYVDNGRTYYITTDNPDYYELSTDDTNYYSEVSVTANSNTSFPAHTIYVRLKNKTGIFDLTPEADLILRTAGHTGNIGTSFRTKTLCSLSGDISLKPGAEIETNTNGYAAEGEFIVLTANWLNTDYAEGDLSFAWYVNGGSPIALTREHSFNAPTGFDTNIYKVEITGSGGTSETTIQLLSREATATGKAVCSISEPADLPALIFTPSITPASIQWMVGATGDVDYTNQDTGDWTNVATGALVPNTGGQSYVAKITYNSGVFYSNQVQVTVMSAPTASMIASDATEGCPDDEIEFSATPDLFGIDYDWYNGATKLGRGNPFLLEIDEDFAPYTITAKAVNGCGVEATSINNIGITLKPTECGCDDQEIIFEENFGTSSAQSSATTWGAGWITITPTYLAGATGTGSEPDYNSAIRFTVTDGANKYVNMAGMTTATNNNRSLVFGAAGLDNITAYTVFTIGKPTGVDLQYAKYKLTFDYLILDISDWQGSTSISSSIGNFSASSPATAPILDAGRTNFLPGTINDITAAQLNTGIVFTVTAKSRGRVIFDNFKLVPICPPIVKLSQPDDDGCTVTLTAERTGAGTLKWFKDEGSGEAEFTPTSGAGGLTHTLNECAIETVFRVAIFEGLNEVASSRLRTVTVFDHTVAPTLSLNLLTNIPPYCFLDELPNSVEFSVMASRVGGDDLTDKLQSIKYYKYYDDNDASPDYLGQYNDLTREVFVTPGGDWFGQRVTYMVTADICGATLSDTKSFEALPIPEATITTEKVCSGETIILTATLSVEAGSYLPEIDHTAVWTINGVAQSPETLSVDDATTAFITTTYEILVDDLFTASIAFTGSCGVTSATLQAGDYVKEDGCDDDTCDDTPIVIDFGAPAENTTFAAVCPSTTSYCNLLTINTTNFPPGGNQNNAGHMVAVTTPDYGSIVTISSPNDGFLIFTRQNNAHAFTLRDLGNTILTAEKYTVSMKVIMLHSQTINNSPVGVRVQVDSNASYEPIRLGPPTSAGTWNADRSNAVWRPLIIENVTQANLDAGIMFSIFGADNNARIGFDDITFTPVCPTTFSFSIDVTQGNHCGGLGDPTLLTVVSDDDLDGATYLWQKSDGTPEGWSNASGTNDEATYEVPVTASPASFYRVTVTKGGFSSTKRVTITCADVFIDGTLVACFGETTELTAVPLVTVDSYKWEEKIGEGEWTVMDGETEATIDASPGKSYRVTVMPSGSASEPVTISVPDAPATPSIPSGAYCPDELVTLSITEGTRTLGATYTWSVDGVEVGGIDSHTYQFTTEYDVRTPFSYPVTVTATLCGVPSLAGEATITIRENFDPACICDPTPTVVNFGTRAGDVSFADVTGCTNCGYIEDVHPVYADGNQNNFRYVITDGSVSGTYGTFSGSAGNAFLVANEPAGDILTIRAPEAIRASIDDDAKYEISMIVRHAGANSGATATGTITVPSLGVGNHSFGTAAYSAWNGNRTTWTTWRREVKGSDLKAGMLVRITSSNQARIAIDDVAITPICPPVFVIDVTPGNHCGGSGNPTLLTVVPNGSLDGATYLWQESDGISDVWSAAEGTNDEATYEVPPTSNLASYYRVIVTKDGLSTTRYVTITCPEVSIEGYLYACADGTTELTAIPLVAVDSYKWEEKEGEGAWTVMSETGATIDASAGNSYRVTIMPLGSVSDPVTVSVPDAPATPSIPSGTYCPDELVVLSVIEGTRTQGATYTWVRSINDVEVESFTGDTYQFTTEYDVETLFNYSVKVTATLCGVPSSVGEATTTVRENFHPACICDPTPVIVNFGTRAGDVSFANVTGCTNCDYIEDVHPVYANGNQNNFRYVITDGSISGTYGTFSGSAGNAFLVANEPAGDILTIRAPEAIRASIDDDAKYEISMIVRHAGSNSSAWVEGTIDVLSLTPVRQSLGTRLNYSAWDGNRSTWTTWRKEVRGSDLKAGMLVRMSYDAQARVAIDDVTIAPICPPAVILRKSEENCFVTLTAVANGSGPFTYEWYKGGVPYPNSSSDPAILEITDQLEATANYTVKVTDKNGNDATSSAISVTLGGSYDLLWTGGANNSNWGDYLNWEVLTDVATQTTTANTGELIPSSCDNVYISAAAHLPNLTNPVYCNTIHFLKNASIGGIHYLNNTGAITVDLELDQNRWYLLSPVLAGQTVGSFNPQDYSCTNPLGVNTKAIINTTYRKLEINNATASWSGLVTTLGEGFDAGGAIAMSSVYSLRATGFPPRVNVPDSTELATAKLKIQLTGNAFLHEPTSGDFNIPISFTDVDEDGYIWIGNPYMSHLDLTAFHAANSAKITTLSQRHSGFEYSSDGLITIPPLQSFLVQLSEEYLESGGSPVNLTFNASTMSIVSSTDPLRSSTVSTDKLNLQATIDGILSNAYVVAEPDASNSYLHGEDALTIFTAESPIDIYTMAGHRACDINRISAESLNGLFIPVTIRTKKTGALKLEISGANSFYSADNVYLFDKETDTYTSLFDQAVFNIEKATEDNIEDRLYLVFERRSTDGDGTSIAETQAKETIFVYGSANNIIVKTTGEQLHSVTIYDVAGRMVLSASGLQGTSFTSPALPSTSTYIVTVVTNQTVSTKKVFIK